MSCVQSDRQPHEEHHHDTVGSGDVVVATAAQATTAAASSLQQGEVLAELVALHARWVPTPRLSGHVQLWPKPSSPQTVTC
jgi:hypothetical protein